MFTKLFNIIQQLTDEWVKDVKKLYNGDNIQHNSHDELQQLV